MRIALATVGTTDTVMRHRAHELAAAMATEDGLSTAVGAIESLAG